MPDINDRISPFPGSKSRNWVAITIVVFALVSVGLLVVMLGKRPPSEENVGETQKPAGSTFSRLDARLSLLEASVATLTKRLDEVAAVAKPITGTSPIPTTCEEAYLIVRSNVAGDLVLIDGLSKGGSSKRPIQVCAGHRSVKVSKNGYVPYLAEVDLGSMQTLKISAILNQAGR